MKVQYIPRQVNLFAINDRRGMAPVLLVSIHPIYETHE